MSSEDKEPYLEFMDQETLQGYLEFISNHPRLEMDHKEMLNDFSQFDDEIENMIEEAQGNDEFEELKGALGALIEMPDTDLSPFAGNSYAWRMMELSHVFEYAHDKILELTGTQTG